MDARNIKSEFWVIKLDVKFESTTYRSKLYLVGTSDIYIHLLNTEYFHYWHNAVDQIIGKTLTFEEPLRSILMMLFPTLIAIFLAVWIPVNGLEVSKHLISIFLWNILLIISLIYYCKILIELERTQIAVHFHALFRFRY